MRINTISLVFLIVTTFSPQVMSAVIVGKSAPDFTLDTYTGKQVSLSDFAENLVVLEWYAHDCPFVGDHYDDGDGHMQVLQREFTQKGIVWLTINSNHNALSPPEMVKLHNQLGMQNTAFLSDLDGQVGRQYGVTATPQMFVINKGLVAYQGAIDDRNGFIGFIQNRASAKNYVRMSLEAILGGQSVAIAQTKPYGCKMKYAK